LTYEGCPAGLTEAVDELVGEISAAIAVMHLTAFFAEIEDLDEFAFDPIPSYECFAAVETGIGTVAHELTSPFIPLLGGEGDPPLCDSAGGDFGLQYLWDSANARPCITKSSMVAGRCATRSSSQRLHRKTGG
jgi:hypothetical protein